MASNATKVSFLRHIVYASRKEMDVHAVIDVVLREHSSLTCNIKMSCCGWPWVAVGGTSKQNLLTSEAARKVMSLEHGVNSVQFVGPFGMHKYEMLVPMSQWKEMVRIGFIGKVAVAVKGRCRRT